MSPLGSQYWFSDTLIVTPTRQSVVDLLRFIAAMMVLFFHYRLLSDVPGNQVVVDEIVQYATFPWTLPITKFGFMGVNLFFMISGYIIFMTALSKTALGFVATRALRLYPAYWLAVTVTYLLCVFLFQNPWQISFSDYLANLTMIQPYLGVSYVDPVYWTLVVELHFYFLVFVLLVFRQLSAWRFWLSIWLMASFLDTLGYLPHLLSLIFPKNYAGYFIAGMIAFSWNCRKPDFWSVMMYLASFWLCTIHIEEQLRLYNFGFASHQEILISIALIAAFFVTLFMISLRYLQVKTSKWVTFLGGITYPLYLVHHEIGRQLLNRTGEQMTAFLAFTLTLSIALLLSYVVYWFGEKKLRYLLQKYYNFAIKKVYS